MGLLESLLDGAWVKSQAMGNPFEFWVYTAVVFLTAAVFFFTLGRRLAQKESASTRKELEKTRDMLHRANERISELESTISGLRASLAREKDKNVELASRLDKRHQVEERRRNEELARAWVMGLTPSEKRLVLRIARKGYHIAAKPMTDQQFTEGIAHLDRGVDYTRVKSHEYNRFTYKIMLNDFGDLAASVAMDLLEEVEEYESPNNAKDDGEEVAQ